MKNDVTAEDGVLSFLSAFWSSIFPGKDFSRGISASYAAQASQAYQAATEVINGSSVLDIPLLDREINEPLVIREEDMSVGPLPITYGSGIVYGEQPAGTIYREGEIFEYGGKEKLAPFYYFSLPDSVVEIGSTILNRLHNPESILLKDSDFITVDSGRILAFAQNPFESGLFTVKGEEGERTSVIWLSEVLHDRKALHRRYGHPFFPDQASTENLRVLCKTLFSLYAGGPSQKMIDGYIAACAGQPVVVGESETVELIDTFGDNTIVASDKKVYVFVTAAGLRSTIKEGVELTNGSPLTEVTRVDDIISDRKWWQTESGFVLDRGLQHPDYCGGPIFLPNAEVKATPVTIDSENTSARFTIYGSDEAIEKFWEKVDEGSPDDTFLGDELWKLEGVVDDNGDPDFDYPVLVNPMQLFVENILGASIVGVRVQADQVSDVNAFLENLRNLRRGLTPISLFVFFIDYSLSEEYDSLGFDESHSVAHGAGIYEEDVDFTSFVTNSVNVKTVISC